MSSGGILSDSRFCGETSCESSLRQDVKNGKQYDGALKKTEAFEKALVVDWVSSELQ